MQVYYKHGDVIEYLHPSGYWQYGAVITKVIVVRQLKTKSHYVYNIAATNGHQISGVGPQEIRYPTRYPTRKAVWTLQVLHRSRSFERGETPPKWMISHLSFCTQQCWNHSLDWMLQKISHISATHDIGDLRIMNHQTGEIIPVAALL